MVNLQLGSGVDQARFPNIYHWDTVVRKHFEKYQRLIDAHTYRLQRIQRGLLVTLPPPSHSPTPSTTTLNYSPSKSSSASRKWVKSTSMSSTSTRPSTPASLPTSTGHLAQGGTCPYWEQEWADPSSLSPLTSTSPSPPESCFPPCLS